MEITLSDADIYEIQNDRDFLEAHLRQVTIDKSRSIAYFGFEVKPENATQEYDDIAKRVFDVIISSYHFYNIRKGYTNDDPKNV
ncbi:MAG: hypothetical protein ACJAZX_000825 [Rickettsiales bacterium]|jgi:hypothetical protein